MIRSSFKAKPFPPSQARSKQYDGPPITPRTAAVRVVDHSARLVVPVEKERALQHLGYMTQVRKLPCARCGTLSRPRQFCHADEGKGTSIKTDCRRGWPGCAACHYFVGSTGGLGKDGRRGFEERAGSNARAQIWALGLWPARLPMWSY